MGKGEIEWLWKKIEPLVKISESFENDNLKVNEGHHWSILKLLILAQWVWVYTTIIPKHVDQCYYIDLLAGSGAMRVKETNDIVIGSPLIAHLFAREDFDKILLVEIDKTTFAALQARLKRIIPAYEFKSKFELINADCNDIVSNIVSKVENTISAEKKKVHCLTFVDNWGLDTAWKTIEALMQIYTDLIILFPTVGIRRVFSIAKDSQGSQAFSSSLVRFFGDYSWKEAEDVEDLLELYKSKLSDKFKEKRRRDLYVSEIRVGDKQFYYDLILVCKKGPYVDAWEYIKKRLNWTDPETVNIAMNTLKRRDQVMLEIFAGLDYKISEIEKKKPRKAGKRTHTLEDFT